VNDKLNQVIKYAKRNDLPLWAVIERVSRGDYDGPLPDRATVDGDTPDPVRRGDYSEMGDKPERRFRVIKKPDGTYYMERHTGSLRGIQGKISIYDTHAEAMEAMGEMG